jgi:IS30 family transposase
MRDCAIACKRTAPNSASRAAVEFNKPCELYQQTMRAYMDQRSPAHLRRTRGMRRSRHHTQKTDVHGRIVGAVSISERPAAVEDRAVPGHWEGDLLFGSRSSQIATLVERQTRYVMLVKVASNDTATVVNALIKNARKLPQELYKSLTWDRGHEMAGAVADLFTALLNAAVQFHQDACRVFSFWIAPR